MKVFWHYPSLMNAKSTVLISVLLLALFSPACSKSTPSPSPGPT